MNSFLRSLVDFVYPPFCFHCSSAMSESRGLLCEPCEQILDLIDPSSRCPRCFSEDFEKSCFFCNKNTPLFYRLASAFDYVGPAASLIKQLKYCKLDYLAETLAAFLVAQLSRLDWPLPDVLVPVPISFAHRINRGYNQSLLIAETVGTMIGRPVQDVLQRSSDDLSQAGLSRYQRMQLKSDGFSLKNKHELQDQTVLLIDDVMTTGTTLNRCTETLWSAFPGVVYAMTVCRTLK